MAEVDLIEDDESEPEYNPKTDLDRVKRKYTKRSREEIEEHKKKNVKGTGSGRRRSGENYTKGFTLMIVEGKKFYKCEICSKVLHRRLSMHRGTHSNERKVKCEECGSLC
jgi:DNA-directed RNA polymerase subunit RPC12/RpoP